MPHTTASSAVANFDELPDTALIRLRVIVGHSGGPLPLVPVSRSTWWRLVKAGTAPQPIKLGPGITAWRVGDIRAWLGGEAA
jgi:hypothetical protein